MSKWIVRQADRIKRRDEHTPEQRRRGDQVRRLIHDRWAEAWQATLAAMSSDIVAFNAQFPDDPKRHITSTRSGPDFTARRNDDNRLREIQITMSDAGIHLRIAQTGHAGETRSVIEEVLPFGVSDSSTVSLLIHGQGGTPAETAERLLLMLF